MEGTIKFSNTVTTSSLPNSISTPIALNTYGYSIPPRSARRLVSGGLGLPPRTGWVSIKPRVAKFHSVWRRDLFVPTGHDVTEAGVPPVAEGKAFRLYAESSGDFEAQEIGSIQSGLVVSNSGSATAAVDLALTTLEGVPTGLGAQISVLPNGQVAKFLKQDRGLRKTWPDPFQGILRITTDALAGVAVAGLRGRYNERKDFLIATTSPVDENRSPVGTELVSRIWRTAVVLRHSLSCLTAAMVLRPQESSASPHPPVRDSMSTSWRRRPTAALNLTSLSATPGDIVVLRAEGLDPVAATFATFEFGTARSIDIPVRSVDGNEVRVTVPFFIDPESLTLGAGRVSVSLKQEFPGGSAIYGPIDNFSIGELPSSAGDPGQVTLQVLDQPPVAGWSGAVPVDTP